MTMLSFKADSAEQPPDSDDNSSGSCILFIESTAYVQYDNINMLIVVTMH